MHPKKMGKMGERWAWVIVALVILALAGRFLEWLARQLGLVR